MAQLAAPPVGIVNRLLDAAIVPGMLTFTRAGYCLRNLLAEPLPESLAGRRVVVTGATSGLGLATSRRLAGMGATLVLVGRDASKLADVAAAIGAEHGVEEPQTELANLEVMNDVRALAARLLADPSPIHVLINNAGALFPARAVTTEGNERSLAVNLMSPFLLTNLLIPRLVASAPARIVNVSSGGMYTQRIHIDDLQNERGDYDGARSYARAKRGQVILTELWARDLADRDVAVHAMHPGWADTPGVRTSLPQFYKVTRSLLRSADEGADTIIWLAAARKPAETSGGFWLDRQAHPTHLLPGTRESEDDRQRLWEALEKLTGRAAVAARTRA